MDALDYWRLCEELSVAQAALLIAGKDPSNYQNVVDSLRPVDMPEGYAAAKAALINAIVGKRLPATIVRGGDEDFPTGPDWQHTTVQVEALRNWLSSRGFESGFFFPRPSAAPIIY